MPGSDSSAALPVIDVGPLTGPAPAAARARVAGQIQAACRERGFFYVTSHRVPAELLGQLAEASAEFFALPLADDSGGPACPPRGSARRQALISGAHRKGDSASRSAMANS